MPEQLLARSEDLIVEAIGDELLVFDTTTSRAHSLNATAAAVWQACDGTRSRQQISEQCQLDALAVDLALDNLADSKLLDDYTPLAERVSRRTVIRRIALTGAGIGVALPVIRSIVAPSAAMAGSTAGTNCTTQADCTGAGSHCHSTAQSAIQLGSGQCHPSTCVNTSTQFIGAPHCASHPCCNGLTCFYSVANSALLICFDF